MSLGLTAMRDSEVAAESQGIDVAATKFWVYAASAFGSGMAAALYFLMNLRISPDAAFGVNWSAYLIFIVVIGGIGTIEGPIVGTLLFFLLRELLADYGAWYLIVIGLVAVVTMIACPMGLWGYVARRFDLYFFPVQRRVHVPAAAPPALGPRDAPTPRRSEVVSVMGVTRTIHVEVRTLSSYRESQR